MKDLRLNSGDLYLFRGSSFISFQHWPSSLSDELADYGDSDIAEVVEVCAPALIKVGVDTEMIEPEWGSLKTGLQQQRTYQIVKVEGTYLSVGEKYPNFFMLVSYLLTLPSSSVNAERGFSRMKMIKNDWRNRLGARHLTELMIICSETDDIPQFNPEPAIHLWNTTGLRSKRPFYMDEKTHMESETEKEKHETVEDELANRDIAMLQNKAFKQLLSLSAN